MKVPQSTGQVGWILLGYENSKPVCIWCTQTETTYLSVCLDERLFGDTILRAEYTNNAYIISDVFVYNSICIFMVSTFKQRYEWLKLVFEKFEKPGRTRLIHKSNATFPIKGFEYYDSKDGSRGCFEDESGYQTIIKTEIPDVYTVKGQDGYVLVPTLKASILLRSKGDEFRLKCLQKGANWEIIAD